jgi:uncharacterized protein (TIGR02266 family)
VARDPRYAVEIEVNCATRGMFTSNRVMNLSRGGLFLRADRPFPLQSEVELVLILPGERIEAKGRVIWNYDMAKGSMRLVSGSGIRFVDMSSRDRAVLETYLSGLPATSSNALEAATVQPSGA